MNAPGEPRPGSSLPADETRSDRVELTRPVEPTTPRRHGAAEEARQVDAACAAFEAGWRSASRPAIEDALHAAGDGPDPGLLLFELLALEVELRREAGEEPDPRDYRGRFPADLDLIDAAFREAGARPADATPHDSVAGGPPLRRFGPYELLGELARGGMGVVYRARHEGLGRVVALKMILAGEFAGEAEERRFAAEAGASARLDHPNIVPIYEVGRRLGRSFYTMKLVEGGSLADRLGPGRPPCDPREAARLVRRVAQAVHYAHGRGVIHRDLKPSNILIGPDGAPMVADFGLAKRLDEGGSLTASGVPIGTPSYMAPEQAAGGAVTAAADVYSLGAILYHLLAGRPPFRGSSAHETLAQVLDREPDPPRRHRAGVPRELEAICLKCLEKRPGDRYESAGALADDLVRYLAGDPVQARRRGLIGSIRRWIRREPALASRLLGQSAILVLTQVNYLTDPTPNPAVHRAVTVVEATWLIASAALGAFAPGGGRSVRVRAAWVALDVAMLTATLRILDAASSALVVGYPLLIAASGIWGRVGLVWLTTALSIVGFGLLTVDARLQGLEVDRNLFLVLPVALALHGFVVSVLVRRLRTAEDHAPAPPTTLKG